VAAKGGGAWKVAYADFVTAMMAFFLVMWLCAQDLKVRQSVAKYFMDPSGVRDKPGRTGSVIQHPNGGNVPLADEVAMGQGRHTFSPPNESSPPTKLFSDWLHGNEKAYNYWQKQAEESRRAAAVSKEVIENRAAEDDVATHLLSKQLKEEFNRGLPGQTTGLYKDLLVGALAEVNWTELARDLLAKH
jgi:chemotaxis protein MotB